MATTQLLNPYRQPEDTANNPLRPVDLTGFIGQDQLREQIVIALEAARRRKEMLDHLLFAGPPGTGKTTLARIVASSLGGTLIECTGNTFGKPKDLIMRLQNMQEHTVLFIDEIHDLRRVIEETLYPAMEDLQVDLLSGQQNLGFGPARVAIPSFTLIGATTQSGKLSAPLRDRFGIDVKFELYSQPDLAEIVGTSAEILKVSLLPHAASIIAGSARGTPRIANRLLRRMRDYAQVRGNGTIDGEAARATLALQGIDSRGLDERDRKYLNTLQRLYEGGPAGVRSLAASLGEAQDTLEEVIEPYLLQQGLIVRTAQGRKLTPEGRRLGA